MPSRKHPESSPKNLGPSYGPEILHAKGTYTLAIFVPVEKRADVGALGTRIFPKGYYAYTGTAFGKNAQSLSGRIIRHMRRDKKRKRWHIDHLLAAENVEITSVIAACTRKKMECEINQCLREKLQANIPVRGFGASDCRNKCESHLLYLGLDRNVTETIAELYSEKTQGAIYLHDLRRSPQSSSDYVNIRVVNVSSWRSSLPISVRTATEDDLEAIYKIELECFADDAFTKRQLEYLLTSASSVTLIAVLDEEPVGFITGSVDRSRDPTVCHVYTLDVKRNYRRRGIASILLDLLEQAMAGKGAKACYLEARTDNIAAQNLYVKHGYRPFTILRDYYGFGAEGLRLKKDLH